MKPEKIIVDASLNKRLDFGAIEELAKGIKSEGQLVPAIVTKNDDGTFNLIAGHRRLEACKLAKRDLLVTVREAKQDTDSLLINAIENIARKNLTPLEEADTIKACSDATQLSARALASKLCTNNVLVSERLILAKSTTYMRERINDGRLGVKQAIAIIKAGKELDTDAIDAACEQRAETEKNRLEKRKQTNAAKAEGEGEGDSGTTSTSTSTTKDNAPKARQLSVKDTQEFMDVVRNELKRAKGEKRNFLLGVMYGLHATLSTDCKESGIASDWINGL